MGHGFKALSCAHAARRIDDVSTPPPWRFVPTGALAGPVSLRWLNHIAVSQIRVPGGSVAGKVTSNFAFDTSVSNFHSPRLVGACSPAALKTSAPLTFRGLPRNPVSVPACCNETETMCCRTESIASPGALSGAGWSRARRAR